MILAHVCAGSLSSLYFILSFNRLHTAVFHSQTWTTYRDRKNRFPVLVWADLNMILAHACAGSLSSLYFILSFNRLHTAVFHSHTWTTYRDRKNRFPVLVWADLNMILAHACAGSLSSLYFILSFNRLHTAVFHSQTWTTYRDRKNRFPVLVWADLNRILAHDCAGSLSSLYFILDINRLHTAVFHSHTWTPNRDRIIDSQYLCGLV